MRGWLVTAIPSWLLLIGLVVFVAGGAVLIQRTVRRRFPALAAGDRNDVTKFTYGFIGFVVSSMWGQINAADGNARAGGAATVQMARDATVFVTADAARVRESLLAYELAALAEWSAGDHRSADADSALAAVYTAYGQLEADTDLQKVLLAKSHSNLDTISQARTVRILAVRENTGPPWQLWTIILLTCAMVLGTVIIYGVERPGPHYSMVAIVGITVAANLFLVLELAHPFIGAVATSPAPLHEAVRVLSGPGT